MDTKADETSVFTDEEVREVKKVFSMVDKDGSGTIDAAELSTLISSLTKEKPSRDALERFIKKVDKNGDGQIQWEELLAALGDWIKAETAGSVTSPAKSRKRQRAGGMGSPNAARAKLHKRIAAFFVCFKQSDNFESIRSKFIQLERKNAGSKEDTHLVGTKFTPEQKTRRLKEYALACEKLPQCAAAINGNNPAAALKATTMVANILSVVEMFPTPDERMKHSEFLVRIFQRVQEMVIIPRICLFLKEIKQPKLQFQALRIINFYAPGPRIAHTPVDSVLHPDRMLHKEQLFRANAVPTLIQLLRSPFLPVRIQSVVALGTLASYNHVPRNMIISMGVIPKMLQLIGPQTPLDFLRKLAWALSVFCGHTHKAKNPPPYEAVSPCLKRFAYIIYNRDDAETLVNTCCAMSYLLPGIIMEDMLCKRLVQLLKYPSVTLQSVLIRCLTDLLRSDDASAKKFISFGLLQNVRTLLKASTDPSEYNLRLDACELISVFAGEKGYIQDVIDADLIPVMVYLLFNDEFVRWKAIKTIQFATRGQKGHIKYLVEKQDIVKVLGNSLSFFKMYDSVLRDVYNHYGPSFNFSFVEDVVEAVENLMGACSQISESYINYFDMEIVDKMKVVMNTLVTEMSAEMLAWRDQRESSIPLEIQIRTLMQKIAEMHERCKTAQWQHIGKNVKQIVKDFNILYSKNESKLKLQLKRAKAKKNLNQGTQGLMDFRDGENIKVKCYFNGDNRVLSVPSNVSLSRLRSAIQVKYGRTLIIQYEDLEGDKITIDSVDMLQRALVTASGGQLKLHLLNMYKDMSGGRGYDKKGHWNQQNDEKSPMYELAEETHFRPKDLKRLLSQFQKQAINGRINKTQFLEGLKQISRKKISPTMAEQLFNSFDKSKDGFINFREFVCGLSVLYKGDNNERLQLCFNAYDLDGDGTIDRSELFHIMQSMYNHAGNGIGNMVTKDMIEKMVDNVFEKADSDGDGCLDFDEFKRAVLQGQIGVQSFWSKSL